jgi:hypothetical protein
MKTKQDLSPPGKTLNLVAPCLADGACGDVLLATKSLGNPIPTALLAAAYVAFL